MSRVLVHARVGAGVGTHADNEKQRNGVDTQSTLERLPSLQNSPAMPRRPSPNPLVCYGHTRPIVDLEYRCVRGRRRANAGAAEALGMNGGRDLARRAALPPALCPGRRHCYNA